MNTQLKTMIATQVDSSAYEKGNSTSASLEIRSFCELQAEQLTSHTPILFTQIIYHDPITKSHQGVMSYAPTHPPLTQSELDYLRSEQWLTDFPPAFTLNEANLNAFAPNCYICPLGYRNHKPEYFLVFASAPLSSTRQRYIKQSAVFLSKYLDVYWERECQQAEIQLLEQVVQRVGHQLRNPLALAGLYAENLRLGLPPGNCQEQAIIIKETIQDLDNNLNELIYCGQKTKLRFTLEDLRNLVIESIQGFHPWIERKQLKVVYPNTSTTLAIDRLQMKQVFDNLLSNAIHFSPESGTITCSWQIFQDEIMIQIADRGPGLNREDLQKIFTPFYSRRSGGTGLGLTIAKKIVLDHQGSIWGEASTKGAQFCLSLPRPPIS